jgi:hypothetical protein
MNRYLKTKRDYLVLGLACLAVAALCLAGLHTVVRDCLVGREQYNTPVPFYIGGGLALVLGFWPVSHFFVGKKKHLVRATVFTLCLAPLPFGGEGTLVPAGLGLIAPFLFLMLPHAVILTFTAAACLSLASDSFRIALTGKGISESKTEKPNTASQPIAGKPGSG